MFENDLETINMYEKEKQYPNIRYVKPIYLINPNKNCLPYFRTFPIIRTYRGCFLNASRIILSPNKRQNSKRA